jgi:hypothetical protein
VEAAVVAAAKVVHVTDAGVAGAAALEQAFALGSPCRL